MPIPPSEESEASAPARLVSIQVGTPRLLWRDVGLAQPLKRSWRSAFVKEPVAGEVYLGKTNLAGDRQADPRFHGGPDMAVLCYSADHYPDWRARLQIEGMGPGGFGENFTISGQDELSVCIGDVYRVGEARVQVSQPRGPCYKISYRWRRPDLLGMVEESGRHGWYLRVLDEGSVRAGLPVELLERPNPDWTVRRAHDVFRARKRERAVALELAHVPGYAADGTRMILSAR